MRNIIIFLKTRLFRKKLAKIEPDINPDEVRKTLNVVAGDIEFMNAKFGLKG